MKRPLMLSVLLIVVGFEIFSENITLAAGEQPPLFTNAGGIVDITIRRALESAGYQVSFNWMPIGRMLGLLKDGQLDVFISASNTPGQQIPHIFFMEAKGVFFYNKSRFPNINPGNLEDLKGYRVATVINSPNTALFTKAGMIVDETPYESMFLKLQAGRVDFVATADVSGLLILNKLFPGHETDYAFTGNLVFSVLRAGFYARNNPVLLEAARRGLVQIERDGTLTGMLKEFFGPENYRLVTISISPQLSSKAPD